MREIKIKRQRPLKQSLCFAIQEAIETGKILKNLQDIFSIHHKKNLSLIKERKAPIKEVNIKISNHDLGRINRALGDYITLRIANIVDEHPAAQSLKDLDGFNLSKIRKIPQIKEILESRDNWIGHINKRYIGPIAIEKLYNKELITLLHEFMFRVICTKEK